MASQSVGSNVATGAVDVLDTATQIAPGRTTRKSIIIQNAGAASIVIGGPTVTTATGLELPADGSVKLEDYNGPVYGIAAVAQAGTDDTRFFEVY